jgi:sugar/nucleoside kinase (ribokinase family)
MIICIGNAMVDSLQFVEDEVIEKLQLNKARMTLVDKDRSNFLQANMSTPTLEAGGSAANTAYWIAQLGGKAGFIGKISNDELGIQFKKSLTESGLVDLTVLEDGNKQTGLCAIFVTPDGERTMNTYLGAGELLSKEDISEEVINNSNLLYMEGYLWDKPSSKEAFMYASKINTISGGKNAITLSDVFCVEAHRESFIELIKNNINYVFTNEEELISLTQKDNIENAITFFIENFSNVDQLICTLGPQGAVVVELGEKYYFPAMETNVVDKTGAGDFFAAGYLYGLQNGLSMEDAVHIANKSAAHVISELGVRPNKEFN